jgi:predicted nucleic acid-binding protein
MLIVDTGFLVALYIRRDKLHPYAVNFLQQNQKPLITAAPAIVESCYFLDAKAKIALLALRLSRAFKQTFPCGDRT